MDLTIYNAMTRYAQLKIDAALIDDELKQLKPAIEEAAKQNKNKLWNDLGTFVRSEVETYEFDDEIKAEIAKEKLKIKSIENKAIKEGKAQKKVRVDLKFFVRKDKESVDVEVTE